MRNLTGNHFWGRQHNMLSIIAFIGGAAIGGFDVGISAVLEIGRINSRGWEWYYIAEKAVSELNRMKDKRRSEENTSELKSLKRTSYDVHCLKTQIQTLTILNK